MKRKKYKMAAEECNVRVEERLKIKIGECKNLPSRNHSGPGGHRDVFCALTLDQEEIFRTTTVERSLNPFFGEEFQFKVPRKFRYLSVYVYTRESKSDKIVGKVAIKRDDLAGYNGKDHWFPLQNVDSDSEVQGKVQVYIRTEASLDQHDKISVRVVEASDLALKGGACDPYAMVNVFYSNGKEESKRTKVRKKTNSPKFEETFTFDVWHKSGSSHDKDSYSVSDNERTGEVCEICISLWHDPNGMTIGDRIFLGEVRIPVNSRFYQPYNHWHYLQPRNNKNRCSKSQSAGSTLKSTVTMADLGSIRLKLNYQKDHVFPSAYYEDLKKILLQSSMTKPITSSAAYILGEIVTSKTEVAQPLVRVMTHYGTIVDMMKGLAHWEISKVTDANTIFRGNTLVSKMMDEAMQLAGSHYLQNTLQPSIELILLEKKQCEIDPMRIKDATQIMNNTTQLKLYVEMIFKAITSSALSCPSLMCELFHVLKELARVRFPNNNEIQYSVISGFIFLRFFAPAILGPRLFDLTTCQIDVQTNRTLTLISKTIQSLGNLVSSRSSRVRHPQGVGAEQHKEEYMCRLLESFQTETHIQALRQFLEIISTAARPSHCKQDSNTMPVVLKEGKMVKRAQGRKRFGRKNFRKRYFRLTTEDLSYSKGKGKEALCRIPLEQIRAVERLDEDSFKMKNMFQIIQSQRALYVQAKNCVEEKEWMDILTKICRANCNRLEKYHPSAYINSRWLCCNETCQDSEGCRDVTRTERLELTLDPDRELQRIHSIVIGNMQSLENLRSLCAAYTDTMERQAHCTPGFVIEDIQSCYETLTELSKIAYTLEIEHRNYQRGLSRKTQYGSKQTPIGDDNYLLLASRNRLEAPSGPTAVGDGTTQRNLRALAAGTDPQSVYTILKYDETTGHGPRAVRDS